MRGRINFHRKQFAYGDMPGSVENLDADDFGSLADIKHHVLIYPLVDDFLLALIQPDIEQIYF